MYNVAEGYGTYFSGYEDQGQIAESELEKFEELPSSIYVG
jgi:hypothetical protein